MTITTTGYRENNLAEIAEKEMVKAKVEFKIALKARRNKEITHREYMMAKRNFRIKIQEMENVARVEKEKGNISKFYELYFLYEGRKARDWLGSQSAYTTT